MLVSLIVTVLAIFALLVGAEAWWRQHRPNSELSRKFIHLTVGSFVAVWPFFLSWGEIRLLSVAFVLVVLASKWLHIFQAIHSVQRPTWGEIYFALIVGLLTFVTQSKGVYLAALLQMSIADGMAAIIGVEFGVKRGRVYRVFGNTKSIIGTLAFLVFSLLILLGYKYFGPGLGIGYVLLLAIAATILENLAVAGLDNLLVPLLVAVVLNRM